MQRWLGSILVIGAGVSFGFMALFKSWAQGISVPMLLMLRFAIGAAVMAGMVVATKQRFPRGRVLGALLAMGAVGYFGESYLYFAALDYAPSGMVAMLLYTYPAVVTVISVTVLKERMTPAKIVALVLAIAGSVLTVLPGLLAEDVVAVKPLGLALGLSCAATYAVYIIVGSKLPEGTGALPSATVVAIGTALMFAVVVGARAATVGEALPAAPMAWAGVAALGVICTVVGVAGFLGGLARVGPVRASTLSSVEPMTTALVGVLALGERLSLFQVVGGVLIVVAAVMSAVAGARKEENSPLRHRDR